MIAAVATTFSTPNTHPILPNQLRLLLVERHLIRLNDDPTVVTSPIRQSESPEAKPHSDGRGSVRCARSLAVLGVSCE
jgi:hypothetical protein